MGKSKAIKCSKCGWQFDNIDNLNKHESEHSSIHKQTGLEYAEADTPNNAFTPLVKFDGECVTGTHSFHTVLELYKDRLEVVPVGQFPELLIPYKSIGEVQVLTSEQTRTFLAIGNNAETLALTAGASILSNMLFNKPKRFLVITFNDKDGPFTVAFKMDRVEEAQQAIGVMVAQAQKVVPNRCRGCGKFVPISILRRNGGCCDFCNKG